LTLTLDHSISLTAHGERGLLTNNSKPRPPDVPDIAHSRQHWSIKMYYVHPKGQGCGWKKGDARRIKKEIIKIFKKAKKQKRTNLTKPQMMKRACVAD